MLAVCKYCNQNISYKSTTGNLGAHLKRSHPSVYLAHKSGNETGAIEENNPGTSAATADAVTFSANVFTTNAAAGSSSTATIFVSSDVTDTGSKNLPSSIIQPPRKKQRTIQNFMVKTITPEERKKIDRDLLELFISDYQPFRIVEDKGFKNFVRNIPGYTLPSRKNISSAMIPALYQSTLTDVKMRVSRDVKSVCLTTDCWTSSQTESYIGVTVHYIDDDFEPQQILLECKSMTESHTSANLAKELKTVTDEYNLTNKVVFAISDNARNIVKAIESELGWKHYGCVAHSLNLVVITALRPIEHLIENVKKIVAFFKRSTNATDMLLSYQIKNMAEIGEPKRLIQQVPTRWNSTFFMFRRFVLLKEAIKHCMALIERDWPALSSDDWGIMEDTCKILQPFEEVTSSISGDQYLTGGMVIVMTNCLKDICEDFLKTEEFKEFHPSVIEVATSLKNGLIDRFPGVEYSKTFGICTLLDPRFKLVSFKIENAVSDLKKHVQSLIVGLINRDKLSQVTVINEDQTQREPQANLSAWDRFDELLKKNKPQGSAQARAIRELQMYLDDEMLPRKKPDGNWNTPSQWWRDHKIIYPHLSELYRTKCNIVATSVPCERLFSKTGLIINEKRCRLKSKKVEQLAFLNANLKVKRFDK